MVWTEHELRKLFLKYLTEDIAIKDSKNEKFNQAIFIKESGHQVFCGTDLGMIMEKFDKAIVEIVKKDK